MGRILGAHGKDGGVRVKSISDVPGRFDAEEVLSLSRDGVVAQEQTCQISFSRPIANGELIIWFRGVRTREDAQPLAGSWLCVPLSDVPEAEEGEYFHYQLVGLKVSTADGEELGELTEILETGSNDVYVIAGPEGEILVPAISKVIRRIDIVAGLMVVDLPEGLR